MKKGMTISQLMNDITFYTVFNRFKNLALNVFKWEGLPPSILEEHIEKALFEHGMGMGFQDPALPVANFLPATNGQGIDIHGIPFHYRAVGTGYNTEYHRDNCAMIFNNKLRIPTQQTLIMYVREIVDVMRTTNVNVRTMKMPFLIKGNKDTILSLKAMLKEIEDNEIAVCIDETMDMNGNFEVFPTGAKFFGNDLLQYRQSIENELLTFLGVNTVPIQKRERLIKAEADSNNEYVTDNVQIMLEARQRGAEALSKLIGSTVTVDLRNKKKETGKGEGEKECTE